MTTLAARASPLRAAMRNPPSAAATDDFLHRLVVEDLVLVARHSRLLLQARERGGAPLEFLP